MVLKGLLYVTMHFKGKSSTPEKDCWHLLFIILMFWYLTFTLALKCNHRVNLQNTTGKQVLTAFQKAQHVTHVGER